MELTVALLFGIVVATGCCAALAWWLWERSHRRTRPMAAGHRPDIDVAHEQEFELYHNALSLCSMKTRVCMAELGIPYTSHHVDLIETGAYENISRHFLAVNPGGTVPVLVHDGHPVYESHEQIRYAADHAPAGSPSLVPADAERRREMQRWIDRSSITEDPLNHGEESAGNAVPGLTLPLFATMIELIPYKRILEGALFHFDKRRPFMFATFKLVGIRRIGTLAPVRKLIARSHRQMAVHLDALERQLGADDGSAGPWILGAQFTLADVSWLVIFERLAQVAALDAFVGAGRRPRCAAYWQRLRERPSYRRAILEHDHPTITHGTRRIEEAKSESPGLRAVLEPAPG